MLAARVSGHFHDICIRKTIKMLISLSAFVFIASFTSFRQKPANDWVTEIHGIEKIRKNKKTKNISIQETVLQWEILPSDSSSRPLLALCGWLVANFCIEIWSVTTDERKDLLWQTTHFLPILSSSKTGDIHVRIRFESHRPKSKFWLENQTIMVVEGRLCVADATSHSWSVHPIAYVQVEYCYTHRIANIFVISQKKVVYKTKKGCFNVVAPKIDSF